jgi:hypothetical protein
MRATIRKQKVVPIRTQFNNNPHYQLDLKRSLEEYPPEKRRKFLLGIQKRAKATGQVSQDYDILSKWKPRQLMWMHQIIAAAQKDIQVKGLSSSPEDVKVLKEDMGEGGTFLYEQPCPMVVTNTVESKDILAIGDHRFDAKTQLNWMYDIVDRIELDLTNDEDFAIYKMISSNSNNHPHQVTMKTKEITALVYLMVKRSQRLIDMFNPNVKGYNVKKCHDFIRSYKEPITKTALKTVTKNVSVKLSEGTIEGMFRTMSSVNESLKQAQSLGTDQRTDIITVERGMIDRYLYDNMRDLAGTDNKLYIIMKVNNSDFSLSVKKLNKMRWDSSHGYKNVASAANAVAGFKKLKIPQSYIDNVVILGYWSQHSTESIDKLQRIAKNGTVTEISLNEAFKLPSMVT